MTRGEPGAATMDSIRCERARTADYIELTKPKLTLLVLFTVFAGFCAGAPQAFPLVALLHTLIGTALISGGACAFNMYLEREIDTLMKRTALRPLAAGRLHPGPALAFALLISVGGLVHLYVFVNHLTSLLSAAVFACYIFLYTPLKTRTWLCTLIGAVPGALPIVMGWTASGRPISHDAAILFAIVFLWQIPHFNAIGWFYRDEYTRAGLAVLSVIDLSGQRTARQVLAFTTVLLPVSLLPAATGMAGSMYGLGSVICGSLFLAFGIDFARRRDRSSARRLFLVSAAYLPALLILLALDRLTR